MDKLRSWLVAFMAVVMLVGFVWRINAPDYYKLELQYQKVNFLAADALVQTRGVEIGKVESVQLAKDFVKVTVTINQDVNIPRGSQFIIKPKGLVGKSMIEVLFEKGDKDYYNPNETIKGITEVNPTFNPAQLEKYLLRGFQGIIRRDDSLLKQLKIINQQLEEIQK